MPAKELFNLWLHMYGARLVCKQFQLGLATVWDSPYKMYNMAHRTPDGLILPRMMSGDPIAYGMQLCHHDNAMIALLCCISIYHNMEPAGGTSTPMLQHVDNSARRAEFLRKPCMHHDMQAGRVGSNKPLHMQPGWLQPGTRWCRQYHTQGSALTHKH